MEIKAGDIISVRHYSGTNLFKSMVTEAADNIIKIKLTKNFAFGNLFEGDPVVVGVNLDGEVKMAGCKIIEINAKESIITLKIETLDSIDDRRIFERFPVSYYADIRIDDSRKKNIAVVKNMSLYGMMIYAKSDFTEEQVLNVDLYIEQKVITIKGEVIWKMQSGDSFEYGINTSYMDFNTKNTLKLTLQMLKKEQEDFLSNINE